MSNAQQQAARQNGAKSVGPVTREGKQRSSKNATRHALSGGPAVLPSESQELFDELKASYLQCYLPESALERDLIDEMVDARWRMRRLSVLESGILNQAFDRQMELLGADTDKDTAMARAFVDVAENSKAWRMLERYQRTLRRSYERARTELQEFLERLANESPVAEQNEPGLAAAYYAGQNPAPAEQPSSSLRRVVFPAPASQTDFLLEAA